MLFVDVNGGTWADDQPDIDQAVEAMFSVAARDVDEAWLGAWLRERVSLPN